MLTHAELLNATPQQIFEDVAKHLFKQGQCCKVEHGKCLYKYQGLSCAVGVHIPDNMYRRKMENIAVSLIPNFYSGFSYLMFNIILYLLLQKVHDNPVNWRSSETMRIALEHVANVQKLNGEFLQELNFSDR